MKDYINKILLNKTTLKKYKVYKVIKDKVVIHPLNNPNKELIISKDEISL